MPNGQDASSLDSGFEWLRSLLREIAQPLVVRIDQERCLELFTPDRAGASGERFAKLERSAYQLVLDLIPVGADMSPAHLPSGRLAACKRGQHQFCVDGLDRSLADDLHRTIQFHLSICRARRLI